MVNWLLKKNREPFTTISSSDLQDLLRNGKVSIVYYGNINTHNGKIIENFARVDDFNSKY